MSFDADNFQKRFTEKIAPFLKSQEWEQKQGVFFKQEDNIFLVLLLMINYSNKNSRPSLSPRLKYKPIDFDNCFLKITGREKLVKKALSNRWFELSCLSIDFTRPIEVPLESDCIEGALDVFKDWFIKNKNSWESTDLLSLYIESIEEDIKNEGDRFLEEYICYLVSNKKEKKALPFIEAKNESLMYSSGVKKRLFLDLAKNFILEDSDPRIESFSYAEFSKRTSSEIKQEKEFSTIIQKQVGDAVFNKIRSLGWVKKNLSFHTCFDETFVSVNLRLYIRLVKKNKFIFLMPDFYYKPMALDPIFWNILRLPENHRKPLSFRYWGAYTCESINVYKEEFDCSFLSIEEITSLFINWLDQKKAELKHHVKHRNFSSALDGIKSSNPTKTFETKICALIDEKKIEDVREIIEKHKKSIQENLSFNEEFNDSFFFQYPFLYSLEYYLEKKTPDFQLWNSHGYWEPKLL